MTFANVLLICIGAIAACTALVFAVETLVAFFFHDEEREPVTVMLTEPVLLDTSAHKVPFDRAA